VVISAWFIAGSTAKLSVAAAHSLVNRIQQTATEDEEVSIILVIDKQASQQIIFRAMDEPVKVSQKLEAISEGRVVYDVDGLGDGAGIACGDNEQRHRNRAYFQDVRSVAQLTVSFLLSLFLL
jgi:hypothetical protein